jgi:EAL domain-containing protein (putative c-di-GMP-specific phosphodiesterase class I)
MGHALRKPFRIDALKQVVDAERLRADAPQAAAADLRSSPSIDLREALDRNWLDIWYQPKLDLHGQGVVGAEGLARVRHPEHGIMFPGSFIPEAKKEDLVRLAEQALRVALRDAAEFAVAGYNLRLAINVPVQALVSLPIGSIVRECRRGQNREWSGIVLEVTEDQIMEDIPLAHEIATQLRIHGVDLAIDDFGSGYSSIARLKDLPFAELKLDRSFVDDCGNDPTNAALCKMVVELAHRFGSLAVAEGIERRSDLAVIRSIGCDLAQGFLFAHAMPKEFLLSRLKAHGVDDFSAAIAANGTARSASA